MKMEGRNTLAGIADRVNKNLHFITSARGKKADVHEVTQLLLSLLGLIVFPFEDRLKGDRTAFSDVALSDLIAKGWPSWTFTRGKSGDLHDLLFHIRNSVSHHRLLFSCDSRDMAEVEIEFRDRKPRASADNWSATINAAELNRFVLLLSDYFKSH